MNKTATSRLRNRASRGNRSAKISVDQAAARPAATNGTSRAFGLLSEVSERRLREQGLTLADVVSAVEYGR